MGENSHPTVVPENRDEYRRLKQRLQRDGAVITQESSTRRPFMIKLPEGETIHRGTLEAIDDAGLDVIGIGNSDVGNTYVHVKERR